MADASEEQCDRLTISSLSLGQLLMICTLCSAIVPLEAWSSSLADVRRVGGEALTIGAEAKRIHYTRRALGVQISKTCDAAICMADEYTLLITLSKTSHLTCMIISTRARNLAQHFITVAKQSPPMPGLFREKVVPTNKSGAH